MNTGRIALLSILIPLWIVLVELVGDIEVTGSDSVVFSENRTILPNCTAGVTSL